MANAHNARIHRQNYNYHPWTRVLPVIDDNISSVTRLYNLDTIWHSVAGPHTDQCTFAVGTSKGAMTVGLVGNTAEIWTKACDWPGDEQAAGTPAVDFWNPNVVLAGMRSGKVRMWDLRSDGANVRMQHPTCVTNVKGLNQNRVLVAGLRHQVCAFAFSPLSCSLPLLYCAAGLHDSIRCVSTTRVLSEPFPKPNKQNHFPSQGL